MLQYGKIVEPTERFGRLLIERRELCCGARIGGRFLIAASGADYDEYAEGDAANDVENKIVHRGLSTHSGAARSRARPAA